MTDIKRTEIKTDRRKFFRQYIEILRPMLKISNKEADVLGELLYQNAKRAYITNDTDRFSLVFNYNTKKEMEIELEMSSAVYRVMLGKLRKAGLIGYDSIDTRLLVYPNENFTFVYEFKIEGN